MFSLKKMVLAGGLLLGALLATSGSQAEAGGFKVRHGGFGHCYRPPICHPAYPIYPTYPTYPTYPCCNPYPCFKVYRPVFKPHCPPVYPWH